MSINTEDNSGFVCGKSLNGELEQHKRAVKVLSDALSKLTDGTRERVSGIALEALCISDDILKES